ncbi:sensor histidine kinase [Paenibacillus sp. CAU 1782]
MFWKQNNPLRKLTWRSIRVKMMAGLFMIVVPLIGFIIYSNVYAIEVVRQQVANSSEDLLSLYRDQLDGRLNEVDNYLIGLMSDAELSDMPFVTNGDERIFIASRLTKEITNSIVRYPVIDGISVYFPSDGQYLYAFRERSALDDRMYIKSHIMHEVVHNPIPDKQLQRKWYIARNHEQVFLVRTFMLTDRTVITAWLNVNSLQTTLDLLGLDDRGAAVLSDIEGNPIVNQHFVHEHGLEIELNAPSFYLTGGNQTFLAIGEQSNRGEFALYAFIPDDRILQHLPTLKWISFLLPFVSLLLLLIGFILLRTTLLKPINRLLRTMNLIRQGNLDVQIKQFQTSTEFQMLNDTFNTMMGEIKDLRISVYEEQLKKQKAELQHLQLQIKPHFFINTLNMLYTLARMKDTNKMEEISLCLIQYFRYMFQSNLSFVALKDELRHVRNYLRIQELRFPGQILYDIQVQDFLLRTPVPPLIIHTFVENVIKHALTLDEPIVIKIDIELIESPELCLHFKVQDSGTGFREGIIDSINQNKRIVDEEGEHIGIWNVKQRLNLMYGQRAMITLSNADPHGAVVTIALPFKADSSNNKNSGGAES